MLRLGSDRATYEITQEHEEILSALRPHANLLSEQNFLNIDIPIQPQWHVVIEMGSSASRWIGFSVQSVRAYPDVALFLQPAQLFHLSTQ